MNEIPVKKVELKLVDMVVDQSVIKFARYDLRKTMILKEGETPPLLDFTTFKEETFEIRKVVDCKMNEVNYLVKVGEEKVFQDLLQISNDDIERIKIDAFNAGFGEGSWNKGASIKNLSWWKRLFKQF